jgi:alpha-glucosidase
MYEWTRSWLRLRAAHSSLRQGRLIDLFYDDDVYVFARQDKNETVIVAFNRAPRERKVTIPASAIGVKNGAKLSPLIDKASGTLGATGEAVIDIPARTAVAYSVR